MSTAKKTLCIMISIVLCIGFCACSGIKKKFSEQYFGYFDSFAELTVFTSDEQTFEAYEEIFKDVIGKYHKLLDAYNEYENTENICTLNKIAPVSSVKVSQELFDFLVTARDAHSLTGGYTSITLGSVTQIWKQAISEKSPADPEALASAAEHTDISCLILDSDNTSVSFSDNALRLDVGAIAKGYVADVAYEALRSAGCDSFLVNLGGTVKAHGQKSDNGTWRSGVNHPVSDKTILSLDISEVALSTSGSYYRRFELDGRLYHHIIDPFTLEPKNTFVSVSVLCPSGSDADALSTALFSMELDAGRALVDSLDNVEAVWILADGSTVSTDGIQRS